MKCPVCKKRFTPYKKNVYLVQTISFTTNKMYHECTDCPRCGCQIKLNERISDKKEEAEKS